MTPTTCTPRRVTADARQRLRKALDTPTTAEPTPAVLAPPQRAPAPPSAREWFTPEVPDATA